MADEPFLSRWSRRKTGRPAPVEAAPPEPAQPQPQAVVVATPAEATPQPEPLPTLDDVALLTPQSDYSRFVASGVDPSVRNAAMKKLFADPHFNVMDGLDTYIDDYSIADPIPLAMLRKMTQSVALGLFDGVEGGDQAEGGDRAEGGDQAESGSPVEPNSGSSPAAEDAQACPDGDARVAVAQSPARVLPHSDPEPTIDDDDADLRLQQDDAAERPGAGPRARG